MILITGATGDIGADVCRRLAEARVPFRAMCRKPAQVAAYSAQGISAIQADFDDTQSLQRAFIGCTSLFLLTPPVEAQITWELRALDVAKSEGITHVVKISAADSNLDSLVPWARSHAHIEQQLRSMPVRWTVLRPTGFMQNLTDSAPAIEQGMYPYATKEGRVSYIDAHDIAAAATHVLTTSGHDHATYFLTGPEALSAREIAARLSTTLGRAIEPMTITPEEMRRRLETAGLSAWKVDGVMAQLAVIAGAHAVDVTDEVFRLTGRRARSLEDWVVSEKARFGA